MILVTGATGLNGSDLVRRLSARGRLEASAMGRTALRGCEFMPASVPQGASSVAKGALFWPVEDAKSASVDVADIDAVAPTVLAGCGHEGKVYPLAGPEALGMA